MSYQEFARQKRKKYYDMVVRENVQRADRIAALESELAALRQVVADVETCIAGGSLKVFPKAEYEPKEIQFAVVVRTDCESGPALYCAKHAPTWQAALHAAAEQVRNTNPERTDP